MEGFSSDEITKSLAPNGFPSQTRAYRSSTRPALVAKSGSEMKIHDWYCHGLSASSDSHLRTVACEIDSQIPVATAWRASSGHDHRDSGSPLSAGGVQASALTPATWTAVNARGRPDRFASPNDATPGAAPQRCRHLRTVSSQIPSHRAICALDSPTAAASTIAARITRRCCVRPARVIRVSSRRCDPVNVIRSALAGDIGALHRQDSHWPLQTHPSQQGWWSTTRRSGRITTMAAPPTSTKTSLQQRLAAHARQRWPQLGPVDIRFRGAFAYVTAELPD